MENRLVSFDRFPGPKSENPRASESVPPSFFTPQLQPALLQDPHSVDTTCRESKFIQNVRSSLILIFCFFCGMFTQYQAVAACVFLFHASFLSFIFLTASSLQQWLGTVFVAVGLSLSMSQIFRPDDGGPEWDWLSFGIVGALQFGAAHIYFLFARIHFRLVKRLGGGFSITCYPVLVASGYSVLSMYSPIGSQCSMAYAMAEWQSFVQIVSVFGITGLNLVILVIATSGVHTLLIDKGNPRRKRLSLYMGSGVFMLNWLFGSFRMLLPSMYQKSIDESASPATAWVEAACIVQDVNTDMLSKTEEVLKNQKTVRFVLWSELAGLLYVPSNYYDTTSGSRVSDFLSAISALAVHYNALIGATYGVWKYPSDKTSSLQYNLIAMADASDGRILFEYAKRFPVPVMEDSVVASANPMGFGNSSVLGPLNAAICFDLDHPEYVRSGASSGILIQTANTWGVVGKYHAISSSFRAVENGMYLIRCGSHGPSGVWDPYGSALAYQTRKDTDVLFFEVPANPARLWTFYSNVGFVLDYFLYAVSLIYLFAFIATFTRWYRIFLPSAGIPQPPPITPLSSYQFNITTIYPILTVKYPKPHTE